ncbi:MAG: DUF3990 domain-containing protein [Candidatus Tectomicrobia bacterium]|uniref:DUF3990 domain-containing protein n=1 Tax=Tectimicrobiota bacterium TaxID=2528274 RepID=A0A933E7Y4_UNCTE|nr:DUF3990 domain-containing protein [Candidatus Tectomicrobia bacterium]MBI4251571.1 DUF3990 domain-containing protein [Candidatus Tectomicrobia bacterium]
MAIIPPGHHPKLWTNQQIILYHATTNENTHSILRRIQITRGRSGTDFGRGFYTTTLERQARSWAATLSLRRGTAPAVIRFDVDREELANLECLFFVRGNPDADDFWSLIWYSRKGGVGHKRGRGRSKSYYDVVVGPVAERWDLRVAFPDYDQVGFHSDEAAELLNRGKRERII